MATNEATQPDARPLKPAVRTTEFWLTILGLATTGVQAFSGHLDPEMAAGAGAVMTGVYSLGRQWLKARTK